MRILPHDQTVLDLVASRETDIVRRAVDWCAINSGSRNLEGLERMRGVLAEVLARYPGSLESVPLQPSREVADDGAITEQRHTDALRLTVRPQAEMQVVLTGHYDTV